ncbi:hypothetical protein Syun_015312 [Stephania yunnanensis]|uniref:Uncharacterized protein n=1 Tax=Stephania yunnanensis TaxID=152371 RepID=A0AAP0P9L3_9MAGN
MSEVVDDLLANGNMIDMVGTRVEIKKAEQRKPQTHPLFAFARDSRTRSFGDGIGGYSDSYFGGGDFGPYRTPSLEGRLGGYGGYSGGNELGGGYGGFGGSGLGAYRDNQQTSIELNGEKRIVYRELPLPLTKDNDKRQAIPTAVPSITAVSQQFLQ